MKLTDLNIDCKLLIVEKLDFHDLINMFEMDDAFQALAIRVYQKKFAHNGMEILQPEWISPFIASNQTIKIANFELAIKVLRYFGPFITKLVLNFEESGVSEVQKVLELANSYADVMKIIEIKNYNLKLLDVVYKPFSNVESVSLQGKFARLASEMWAFNEIFPKLQRLSLVHAEVLDCGSITLKYPHLKHLSLSLFHSNQMSENDAKQLIQLNSQIESLIVEWSSLEFVNFLAETLPNLHSLELRHTQSHSNLVAEICLKNVRNLKVVLPFVDFPKRVTARKLKALKLVYNDDIPDVWFTTIRNSVDFRALKIGMGEVNDQQQSMLIGRVPYLVTAEFRQISTVKAETIIKFLQRHAQLNKVQFLSEEPSSRVIALRNQLPDTWNVWSVFNDWITIERRMGAH